MKTTDFLRKELPLLVIICVPLLLVLFYWNVLPNKLPMHWDMQGNVNGYGPKLLMPFISIGIYLMLMILPLIDPKRRNYETFAGTYYRLRLLFVFYFLLINMGVILSALHYNIPMDKIVPISVLGLFAIIGNYMVNLKQNYFIGIKTPWTLANETVWRKTHVLGGRLWFWGGIFAMILFFIVPINLSNFILISILSIISIIPMAYSYIVFRRLKKGLE